MHPGEKFHEELMTEEESLWAEETEEMFIVRPPVELPDVMLKKPGEILREPITQTSLGEGKRLVSKDAHLLTKEQIKTLLKGSGVI